ncbi:hypothetical protein KSF_110250 [Reticulibacter mediterranei]|uniref:HAMP domain-containing protein n=1 Tax=Reticulibacter mediterranei TaxID=2778369 RepID=A0A8J3J260_9CHLR|nr:hypothetical protein [Reticulibacter mediterranei]GHP00978.1 hypothetical protein KSF_110250 [Reticulibacter mediterranei]
MQDQFARSENMTSAQTGPSYLTARARQESTLWLWWYRLTAPAEPKGDSTFQEVELFRRGRTGSQIILALYFLLIISIPAKFVGTNDYLLYIVAGAAAALFIATILNRLSKITIAGIIVVLTFLAFPIVNIVTTPGGLSMLVLPLFGLLVLPLLCAVSFLPPGWVFAIALVNILFTLLSLTYLPHTAELSSILAIAYAGIVTPIIFSQILVSVVAFVWVWGTTQALQRADRAEELVRLEHDLALQAEDAAHQKQLLEESVHKIVETHMRVANGDFDARVPVGEENVLWQISGPLNNLLARAQRWRHDSNELYHIKLALQQAREENELLKRRSSRLP